MWYDRKRKVHPRRAARPFRFLHLSLRTEAHLVGQTGWAIFLLSVALVTEQLKQFNDEQHSADKQRKNLVQTHIVPPPT